MEWINVKNRLPEVHPATDGDYLVSDFVLVYFGDGVLNKICVANYEVDGEDKCFWVSFSDTSIGDMAYGVTHWMPLPDAPTDESKVKATRAEYFREWRRKNPDRVREINKRYWQKRAKKIKEEGEQHG